MILKHGKYSLEIVDEAVSHIIYVSCKPGTFKWMKVKFWYNNWLTRIKNATIKSIWEAKPDSYVLFVLPG